ncbi:hypothetical protein FQN52_004267 [Onygenales sp. PD_12]|nr:hypothetical protein FQN52_004267 [Onygenales sp. PD_12]
MEDSEHEETPPQSPPSVEDLSIQDPPRDDMDIDPPHNTPAQDLTPEADPQAPPQAPTQAPLPVAAEGNPNPFPTAPSLGPEPLMAGNALNCALQGDLEAAGFLQAMMLLQQTGQKHL